MRPWKRSSTPKRPAPAGPLVEHAPDGGGSLGLDWTPGDNLDGLRLRPLRSVLGDVPVARHQGQDLVAPPQRPRVPGSRRIVPGALADARQQLGLSCVGDCVTRESLAEVILGGGGEAVAAVAEVDEAGISGEDLALGLPLRSVAPAHLVLEPERQAHLLQLPGQLVRGRDAHDRGDEPRGQAVAEERVAVLAAGEVLEEVAPHERLGEGRATVGKQQPEPRVALPPRA